MSKAQRKTETMVIRWQELSRAAGHQERDSGCGVWRDKRRKRMGKRGRRAAARAIREWE